MTDLYTPQSFFDHAALPRRLVHCANSSLLPPVESGPYLSPSVADHPLRPATDHCHGSHCLYHLANQTQAHPVAKAEASFDFSILYGISPIFEVIPTTGQVATVTHPFASLLVSEDTFSLDLHVLGTPPAFILSQDQTLHCIFLFNFLALKLTGQYLCNYNWFSLLIPHNFKKLCAHSCTAS